MIKSNRSATDWLAILLATASGISSCFADAGGIVDFLKFGNPASEAEHALQQVSSETIQGGLAEPARRLLSLDPLSHNGGSVSFVLKVDPERQNYVTVKLWGSDRGKDRGRLLLYLDGMQAGYRHEGDHDVLNQCDDDPLYAGRFVYQTVALPVARTMGRTEVNLKIGVVGPMWPYGQFFKQKQKDLTQPSRGIYSAYSHTSARFVPPAVEVQGEAPERRIRPTEPVEETIAGTKDKVNARLSAILADPARGSTQMGLLAEAYHVSWTVACRKPETIVAFIHAADASVRPGLIGPQWTGAGTLGEAIAHLGADPLLLKALDEEIDVPVELPFIPVVHREGPNVDATFKVPELSGEKMRLTRREAWARFLRASVDWNRTLGRRPYTNQSMIVDHGIYTANRGLAIVAPDRAMPEDQARRYLYEAVGLLPWLGNDLPDANGNGLPDDGSEKPYGSGYHVVTRKGVSRELGWVGTYGETILKFVLEMAKLTGDPKLRDQLIDIQRKRLFFRYPSVDAEGYRTMKLTSEIDARTAHFPKNDAAYAAPDVGESWWMDVAAYTKDEASVGASQQCLEDHQYRPRLARQADGNDLTGMMRNASEYDTVRALPKSSFRIPTDDGQPDFVFADEENAVIALKHGERRLFVNFYFRQERGVSGATRILEVEPRVMRIVTAISGFEVDSAGLEWIRPDHIDFMRTGGFPPPGEEIHQAWAGERLPVAKRPADAKLPEYGNWGPFVGKAAFYHLRYGDYLFAVNTTETKTYDLHVPADDTAYRDLVTGRSITPQNGVLKVGPLSTVILHPGK